MSSTNSSLVTVYKISPNKNSPRNHAIDTITIHSVVGQLTASEIGNVFMPTSRQASSNYGVGRDGSIGLYVDEADRSWCSSSSANDNRAITIEVATDTKEPYAVTPLAYEALIKLLVDICKRNGIPELKWKNDKNLIGKPEQQNMTIHKWFAATSCPNTWILQHMSEIADKVNAQLKSSTKPVSNATNNKLYRVQVGAFGNKKNAEAMVAKLKGLGIDAIIV